MVHRLNLKCSDRAILAKRRSQQKKGPMWHPGAARGGGANEAYLSRCFAAPVPNFNVVDSGVWKFEIEEVIIEIGGVGDTASPPVVERYLLLLMFASFFLRVMCLTSYKTIQGIAVRRFPSSLVMRS